MQRGVDQGQETHSKGHHEQGRVDSCQFDFLIPPWAIFFFYFYFLIGWWLLYNLVLISAIKKTQISHNYIYTHPSYLENPFRCPSFRVILNRIDSNSNISKCFFSIRLLMWHSRDQSKALKKPLSSPYPQLRISQACARAQTGGGSASPEPCTVIQGNGRWVEGPGGILKDLRYSHKNEPINSSPIPVAKATQVGLELAPRQENSHLLPPHTFRALPGFLCQLFFSYSFSCITGSS